LVAESLTSGRKIVGFVAKKENEVRERKKKKKKKEKKKKKKKHLPNGKDVSFLEKILWSHFHESGTGDQSPVLERLEGTNFCQNGSSLAALPEIGLDPSHLLALACGELDVISEVVHL